MNNIIKTEYNIFGRAFFDLNTVLKDTNVTPEEVKYYEMKEKDGIIVLTLYDKNKNQIKVENV